MYYDRLENSYEDEEFVRYSAEDEYTSWDGEHDEDNPEMDLGDDEDYELELEDGEDDGAFEDIDNEDGAYN